MQAHDLFGWLFVVIGIVILNAVRRSDLKGHRFAQYNGTVYHTQNAGTALIGFLFLLPGVLMLVLF